MAEAYWRAGHVGRASFSLFSRGYPAHRAYYVASGVGAALDALARFGFTPEDIDSLRSLERFGRRFLDFLSTLRFTGDVRAVPEGTIVFANEPILEIDGPVIEGQLVETMLLNTVTTHTNLASKAARIAHAAGGRPVFDFSARRTHGRDAAFIAARESWLGGFFGTSHVGAAAALGIPAIGTMAHSFVQSFESELEAFRAYATAFPESTVLLVDTWDVQSGVRNAITVAHEMASRGNRLSGIRIDSGDLSALSGLARRMLDDAGLRHVKITVSGGLDEFAIQDLLRDGAPIDAFGVGSAYGVAEDAPHIDTAYKLVEYEGRSVYKASPGKETLPGRKQVWRRLGSDGKIELDSITHADDEPQAAGMPLLRNFMKAGTRVDGSENSLRAARSRRREQMAQLTSEILDPLPTARIEVAIAGRLSSERPIQDPASG